jgi:hypothetical protein
LVSVIGRIEKAEHDSNLAVAAASANTTGVSTPPPPLPQPLFQHHVSPNRALLIARTISLLERLHITHQRNKETIINLQEQLTAAKQAGEETAQKLKQVTERNDAAGVDASKQVRFCVFVCFLAEPRYFLRTESVQVSYMC